MNRSKQAAAGRAAYAAAKSRWYANIKEAQEAIKSLTLEEAKRVLANLAESFPEEVLELTEEAKNDREV